MTVAYIDTKNVFASAKKQQEQIEAFADKNGLVIHRVIKEKGAVPEIIGSMAAGEALIVADVSILGNRFEEILAKLKGLSRQAIRLYVVKGALAADFLGALSFEEVADICLGVYKNILSIKNKKVQADLLKAGKKRGRPFSGKVGKSKLDGREEEIMAWIKSGKSVSATARELGIGRPTLHMFIRRKGLRL